MVTNKLTHISLHTEKTSLGLGSWEDHKGWNLEGRGILFRSYEMYVDTAMWLRHALALTVHHHLQYGARYTSGSSLDGESTHINFKPVGYFQSLMVM